MASYTANSALSPFADELSDNTWTSINIRNWNPLEWVDNPNAGDDTPSDLKDSTWNQGSLVLSTRNISANSATAFSDDFYERIHITPVPIDVGSIFGNIEEEFYVWNAYTLLSKTCSSIDETGTDSISLIGLTPPFTLLPLQQILFSVVIPEVGEPNLEATYTFNFPEDNPVQTITGSRLTLFQWEPLQLIKETLEWFTDILVVKDGTEQRIALRKIPRQSFNFDAYFKDEFVQSIFDAELFKWQKLTWGIPVWFELEENEQALSIGDTVLNVDTDYADYIVGGLVIIWQAYNNFEVGKIDSFTSSTITLTAGLDNDFSGLKWIMPVKTAQLRATVKHQDTPDGFSHASFDFIVKDNSEITGFSAETSYKGSVVLTKATLVSPSQSKVSDGDLRITDYQTGAFTIYSDSDFNKDTATHEFRHTTKQECWEFRQFLHSLYGMQKICFIPTFERDMVLADTIGSSDTSFRVVNIGLSDNMGFNDLKNNIAFVFPDGTFLFREITGISESLDNDFISIDSSLGVEVAPGDSEISFLDKCRLSNDKIIIDWRHSGWHEVKLNFLKVRV